MDKTLGKEYAEPMTRAKFLKDNCDLVEQKAYMKPYTTEEVQAMKHSLSQQAIAISDIETEKKEANADFKAKLDPLKDNFKETLRGIREKAVYVKEQCFKFIDQKDRMVGYYNADGDLVEARPAMPEELQGTIFQIAREKTGTND